MTEGFGPRRSSLGGHPAWVLAEGEALASLVDSQQEFFSQRLHGGELGNVHLIEASVGDDVRMQN
jgi:hypothetical protein